MQSISSQRTEAARCWIWRSSAAVITLAQWQQAGRDAIGRNLFVNGCITQESAPYNDPYWRFRFVSILGFAEVGIEVCDADIQAANLDWPAYFSGAAPCDTGGVQLCAWNSRVVREVP